MLLRHTEEEQSHIEGGRDRTGDIADGIAAALKKLSLREQQLVILKVFEQKSYREISEITGLTESNVGYILHHAMKQLAVLMKGIKRGEQ